jgi:pyridoxal phosphate enzyme (YggS family)
METTETLAGRIAATHARIADAARRAGRAPEEVTLVAVTKTVPAETVAEAYRLGLRVFSENRVQEGSAKRAALTSLGLTDAHWELIGHLQSNKVGAALASFDRIQSLDSLHLAEVLSARAGMAERDVPVLLEVNVAGEASKTGFAPEALLEAARAVARLPRLRPEGLMTVAPIVQDAATVRPIFARLRALRDLLRREAPLADADGGWRELSMGMSDDFEAAIEEGATLVRLGRALFGERPAAGAR